ncbi:non-ribosomal peptide synthase/polyketide synthase, partial [Nocardia altamirensis]|uniref:non-ribosomal peptide synthase/polyketide synthase n=1 Tax=Nocardia altamirensis TaxID=472158 RepID=UPI00114D052B
MDFEGNGKRESAVDAPRSAEALFPLSPAQLGIWYAQHLDPRTPINIAQYVELRGDLDRKALRQACIDASHELGSGFLAITERDGEPMQYIDQTIPDSDDVFYLDLRDEADPEAAAQAWMRAEYGRPLDLLTDRLIRIATLQLAPDRWFWYLRAHHIVLDGFSAGTFVKRISELYTAAITGTEAPAFQPAGLPELVQAEIDYRESRRFQTDEQYWMAQIAGLEGSGNSLSTRSVSAGLLLQTCNAALSPDQDELLETAGARHDSTPAALLIAATAAYLAQWTGNEDVTLSLPVTARTTVGMRRAGGVASNIVPLRLTVRPETSVAELLKQVTVAVSGALRHQRYRHEDIRRVAAGESGTAHIDAGFFGPLVNIMLFHDEVVLGPATGHMHVLATGAVADLAINFYRSQGGARTHIDLQTNPDNYTDDETRRHHARFLEFFDRFLAADGAQPAWALPITTGDEFDRTLVRWNDTAHEVPDVTLTALLDGQVDAAANRIAVDFEGDTLTYAELGASANRLARHLIAAGVGPESLVGLAIPRSLELVVAMQAILRAGGAYVPIDPDHPAERNAYVLETGTPVLVLSLAEYQLELPEAMRRDDLDGIDLSSYSDAPVTDADRRAPLRPSNTAYVIFTSGSTGRPKGVAVTHHAVVNQQLWMLNEYRFTADDVYLQKSAATFDLSVWGYYLPLLVGGKLVLASQDGHRDPLYVAEVMQRNSVTVTDFVPSMLTVFAAQATTEQCATLRAVFVIGEALPPQTVAAFRTRTGAELHNLYGPTEAAVSVTYWEVTDTDIDTASMPIGVPEWNVEVYVLDSRLRPVAIGAEGELYLGGRQLARSYYARPDLTSDRFVANPFRPGQRMYRTGDLVRWVERPSGAAPHPSAGSQPVGTEPVGVLEYVGRTDFQVKFRGQRIELGEIESVLLAHPAIGQAVVLVADTATGQQLVAYVVPAPGSVVDPVETTRYAGTQLSAYMVPASIMVLDTFPLNASGKLDRQALPQPVFTARTADYRPPRDNSEEIVAGVFAEVLSQDLVGIDDNFFELGGNSLVATQVMARVSAAFGVRLGVRVLFEAPTVAGIAARLATAAPAAATPLVARELPEQVPLSPAQQRMWFLNQFDPTTPAYNVPFAVRVRGEADIDAFGVALADVLERQESLRTIFPQSGGGGYQHVLPMSEIDLGIEVRRTDEAELPGQLLDFARNGFDVTREVPIRVRLWEITGGQELVVAVVLHHIAVDGFSFGPLARDMAQAYLVRAVGQEPSWTPLPVQYRDYTLWQRELLGSEQDPESTAAREIAYWRSALAELPDQLELPTDRPRPPVQSFQGGRVFGEIPADLHASLLGVCRAQGASVFMVLHSALAVLLARLSGTTDIAVGATVAGRGEAALDDLIGMFVNTLVLRTQVDGTESFAEFLSSTRESDLSSFAHAQVPFERLVEVLNPRRSQSRHPLFQVMLSVQDFDRVTVELDGLTVRAEELPVDVAQFDLQFAVSENPAVDSAAGGMSLTLTYATDLFDETTATQIMRRWLRVLETVAADAAIPVDDIGILDADDYADLITRVGLFAAPARTLPELLAEVASGAPLAPAVVFEGRSLSYGEVDSRSNRLARLLIERGVGAEDIVALTVPRSELSYLATWGVSKSGAAFLPIAADLPSDRIEYMLSDSGARVGVTVSAVRGQLPDSVDWLVLDELDLGSYSDAVVTDSDRVRPLSAEHPVYVIYTSGTTGQPKGVVLTHAGLANFRVEQNERYGLDSSTRALHFASPSFDASILEFLLAVGGGGALVVVPPGVYGGAELADLIRAERVTHAMLTPSVLASMDPAALAGLRVVIAGGEAVSADLLAKFSAGGRRFFNAYGPTEATIASNISRALRPGDRVTIGGPIRGMQALVLDSRLRPVPVGVAGELYVSGIQLARGYHARAGLTAERFVANPFAVDERMYRTGDVVRWAADGAVEYVGRSDFQVKVRGFRIELGEIDAALTADESVDFAVTVGHTGPAGGTVLVSYVVGVPGWSVDVAELTAALARRLPSYMVPSSVVVIDQVPLTATGKLDRRALPAPVFEVRQFRAPSTPIEEIVAQVFGEVLGVERVGADDDFFTLGGNSLIATQVASRLGTALDTRVPVRMVFDASTVVALATRIESHAGDGARPELVARARPERVPLSLAQQRMWFLNRFSAGSADAESAVNNIPVAIRLSGELDVAALQIAVIDVIDRHESLRTVFPDTTSGPVQVILDAAQIVPDLTPVPVTETTLLEHLIELASLAFDVTVEVPLHARLFEINESEYVLGMVVHHISADGWSMTPLARDIMVAYAARAHWEYPAWTELPVQYADYALWQREVLGSEDDPESLISSQIRYWTGQLAELPDELALPSDRRRPAVASYRGGSYPFVISAETQRGLVEIGRKHNASLFMVMHSALAILLARLSGADDIAIGTPAAGRGEAALDDLVGMFVNTLVLRTNVSGARTIAELLAGVRDTDLHAFAHADVPFERLVEVLNPARSQARHPLFQVMLAFQNLPDSTFELPGLTVRGLDYEPGLAKFDLQLTMQEVSDAAGAPAGMSAAFSYSEDLFDRSTIAGFARRFDRVLAAVAADADIAIGDIDLLEDDERTLVLRRWNATGYKLAPATLPALLDAQIPLSPNNVALDFEGAELTYAEFGARVNQLARFLIADGVGPESLVALGMRRSLELVIGMHAVLKAGGAYVPLDPDHPAERTAYILESAAPVCVLTTSGDALALPETVRRVAIDTVDVSDFSDAPVTDADRLSLLRPENTAYVIYTSGSTGRPKGVAVTHHAIVNQQLWMLDEYWLASDDVYLQKTATTFDVSLWGYFLPLMVGAKLVIAAPDGHRDPLYVAEMIERHGVTVTDFVPSMLTVFAAHVTAAQCASLRAVFVIGEALPPETAAGFRAISSAGLHNLYGPTEAAVSVSSWEVTAADTVTVPIGVPEWNVEMYVLDARLRPVPVGVHGELYLAGRQLAREYRGRPDLTSDRFVANPFGAEGERMYRTGDLVRWHASGVLEYIGRTDFQVKFRGQRIELGEIETVLLAHPAVSQAAVLVVDTATGQQLVAYVVAAPGLSVDSVELVRFGGERLPAYMVPAAMVVLAEFPLNTSGKLDRKALPAPVFEVRAFRAPTTPTEEVVAGVFADVLGVDRVGLDDDFFALGGNSLIATRVTARLGAALDVDVSVRALFDASTVETLAARLASHIGHGARARLVARPRAAGEQIPLSFAQRRMWILNRLDTDSAIYNLPVGIRLTGDLDVAALQAAIGDVIERHESLRTVFPDTDAEPAQVVLDATGVVPDLDVLQVTEATLMGQLITLAATGFDVATEAPVHARLFQLSPSEHVLALVVHHIAADGWSLAPLARDVMLAYTARTKGAAPGWAPLPVQYADYAVWQREVLGSEDDPESLIAQQIRYWANELADVPDELVLPVDRVRPPVASSRGGRLTAEISADIQQRLVVLSRQHNASVFMVLHGALAVLLAQLSGSDDVAIGTPVAGRGMQALDDLVGMFANTLVLRSRIAGDESFAEFLGRVRGTDLAAFGHADVPFERLVEVLNPARSQARHPLFQVVLAVQNMEMPTLELDGLAVRAEELDVALAKFDLQFTLLEAASGGWTLDLTYATDLFDESTVAGIAERWVRVLETVADDASVAVGAIDILSGDERAELIARSGPAAEPARTLPELLAEVASGDPLAPAVVFEGTSLSYGEVDSRSNRLARLLIERGVGAEDIVALTVPRSELSYLATWAISKSGAAFLPIAADLPSDRIEYMLADSGARVGVTVSAVRAELPDSVDWLVLDELDLDGYSDAAVTDSARLRALLPQHPAYVIYTSGTTGRPKGVVLTHAGLANFRAEQNERYGLDSATRALHFASPSFDASILEFLLAVGGGGALVVVPPGMYGGAELADLIRGERVTHVMLTPSVLASMDPAALAGLQVVIAGGEAVSADLIAKFAAVGDPASAGRRQFFNAYGPTESTIASNISDALSPGDRVTVGGPVRGMQALVLDARLQPVPVGVAGELYVSGIQLARGYLDRAGLTADRFVANPFADGVRMYRTGDVVRWTASGAVEYVGRSDFQVKVRGFRIELGEIDAALTTHPSVDFAVTVGHAGSTGVTMLVSYVVLVPGHSVDIAELSGDLGRRLPNYMVPSSIIVIDQVPLTPTGKLDRRALPAPVFEVRQFRAPSTPIEEIVAQVFSEVLGVERVGVDDDFFTLGGNSLIATQVASRLGSALDTSVPVRLLFEASTVAGLAARVESHVGDGARRELVAQERPARVPLSLAQQRMWFLNRFSAGSADAESAVNNIPVAIRLSGELDVAALQIAVRDVIDRHESLRTLYPELDGQPYQEIAPIGHGTRELTATVVSESELPQHLIELVLSAFDVTTEVPLRVELFELSPTEHVLALVAHHISADGFSMGPLTRDVMVAYTARVAGGEPGWQPLAVQYADYALWQRAVLGAEDDPESLISSQIRYWAGQLAELPEELALPSDRRRPAVASYRGGTYPFTISADTQRRLVEVGRAHNASLFMVVHSALAVLLGRLSGTDDVAIGTPVAGRGAAALDDLVGMFVNTLVLRTQVRGEHTIADLLAGVRDTDLQAFAHADVPFERLVEVLNPARSQARHPLFQVMLSFQNLQQTSLELPGLTARGVEYDAGLAKFDLQLMVQETMDAAGEPAGMSAAFSYSEDLFDRSTIADFARRFDRVLAVMAADADIAIGDIDLLEDDERTLVLRRWNATEYMIDPATLVSLFEAQVERTPDAVAVTFEGASLSYAEFAVQARRLARWLIAEGVGPESLVALGMRRSTELVVAMYAVVVSGGAYVPVDPDHPVERIAHVLDTAAPVCVLTTSGDGLVLPESVRRVEIDTLDVSAFSDAPVTDEDRLAPLHPDNTAYVIFTSGSTGRPKGVAVSHSAIVNRLVWMHAQYGLTAGDVVLQKTPATFDVSVWEFFWPLQVGARLVVANPDGHRDPAYLAQLIMDEGVTTAHFVPSMLAVFVADLRVGECVSLRNVFASGEALPAPTAQRLRELTGALLHNLYGPTEAAVDVTFHEVVDADTVVVPIGRPVFNTQVYVLDARLHPVAPGVPGELYLAGAQLARGYVRQPELTSDRFVANPFADGERMYRTGDLVRWLAPVGEDSGATGELEYLGRTDFQVKLRGLRIELGDIESALIAQESVAQAVVVVREDERTGAQLVAYLVAADAEIDTDALRVTLAALLPGYMVPSAFVTLAAFPLNASGKLDRKALPQPVFEVRGFRAPVTPTEEVVAGIFADVLGVEQVGLDDDFFGLGGNSLVATQVVARLGSALSTQIGVRVLFDASTVEALAARLESHAGQGARARLVARVRSADELVPLSFAQQRMWFLNQFDKSSSAYNLPLAIRLTGELDTAALELAMVDVVRRHESLRTRYPEHGGTPMQVVVPAEQLAVELGVYPISEGELLAAATDFVDAGFDVAERVPVRARLFQLQAEDARPSPDRHPSSNRSATQHVLVVVVHHIAADGFSMRPLARDVMTAYVARTQGAAPEWAPLPVQYADYALWQRETLGAEDDPESLLAKQVGYWQRQLAGSPEELTLPTDRPRPAIASYRGATVTTTLPVDLIAALEGVARAQGVSLFMVTHAALAVLLGRLAGTDDVAVGTPVAGRGEAALDELVGMFVNTLVLRTELSLAESFSALLARARHDDLEAFGHADVPFERLVELLAPERSQARNPLFQVMLAFQNLDRATLELPGLAVSELEVEISTSRFDLQFTLSEIPAEDPGAAFRSAGMAVTLTYATGLFDESTAEAMLRQWTRVLTAVAADVDIAVGDIPLLDAAETARELLGWNESWRELGPGATVVELFADQVARTPDAVAVVDPEAGPTLAYPSPDHHPSSSHSVTLTYRDFAAKVHRLAHRLVEAGVGPEVLVAVGIPRSLDLLVAIYAILEAGGGYVPLDLEQPAERIEYVLATADPACVLTTSAAGAALPPRESMLVLDTLDVSAYPATPLTDADRRAPLRPSHPAYAIFTSGSTGRPKGVLVPHSAVVNQIRWITGEYGIDAADIVLFKTPVTFDVSVWELFGPLTVGGRVVVAAPDGHRDPQYLTTVIAEEQVTMTSFVPSMLAVFAGAVEGAALSSLRAVLVAGEAFTSDTAAAFGRVSSAVLYNLYGPTEFTVHATHAPTAGVVGAVPIGKPVWNAQAYVLDARLHPVPIGVAGELYLAGDQLARGYLGRADLTADRFVAAPFGDEGARMYRTGDLVRRGLDGAITYLGRTDFQVKLRGMRIELGEIESALTAHESVKQAVVVVVAHAGTDQLVGYVVPAAEQVVDVATLRAYLAGRLQSHMVPSVLMVLDALPLNANGKLDRRALPEPVFTTETAYRAPRNPIEHLIAELFAEVLGAERVGVDDSFFALGGDSIVSIQLVSRAKARGVLFSARDVFEQRTVAGLAVVAETAAAHSDSVPVLEELSGGGVGVRPLTPVERFMVARPGSYRRFHQAVSLGLPAGIDRAGIAATVAAVIDRHDMLRARLSAPTAPLGGHADGGWRVETAAPGTVEVDALIDHLEFDAAASEAELVEIASAALDAALDRLDPEAGVVIRFVWLNPVTAADSEAGATDRAGYLIVVAHHLVVDGVSWRVLVPDFVAAWGQLTAGQHPQLEVPVTSMRTWAHALEQAALDRAGDLEFWRGVVDGPDPLLSARAFDPTIDVAATVETVRVEVSAEVTQSLLTTVPALFHGGVNDGLLTALAVAVASWRAQLGIREDSALAHPSPDHHPSTSRSATLIRLEGHGREEAVVPGADLSRTVGWFTAIFPVRFDLAGIDLGAALAGGTEMGRAIKAVKEQLLAVPDRGVGYGLLRYLNAETAGSLPDQMPGQISFNYLGQFAESAVPEALRGFGWLPAPELADLAGVSDADLPAMAPLDINAGVADGRLSARIAYPTTLLDAERVREFAALWVRALEAVARHADTVEAGGYTPSDFPLVRSTQADIDTWERRFPALTDAWSLSPLQAGLLFHAQLAASSVDVYTSQAVLTLTGRVSPVRLRSAAQALVDRYDNLRTAFVTDAHGNPVQLVLEGVEVAWVELDRRSTGEADDLVEADRLRRFDLTAPPLIRFTLIQVGEHEWSLVVSNHHIVLDGWSMPLLMRDLLVLYATNADPAGLAPVRSFRYFLDWVAQQDRAASLEAWTLALQGVSEPTLLARPQTGREITTLSDEYRFELDEAVTGGVTALAAELGVTVNTVLQAAWGLVLGRSTGQQDVVFGTTVSGRPAELNGVENMVGLFINTVPVRVAFDPAEPARALLTRLQGEQADLLDHHHIGLTEIQTATGVGGLFDTLMVFESYPVDAEGIRAQAADIDGMAVAGLEVADATHYPLTLIASLDSRLRIRASYLTDLFGADSGTAGGGADAVGEHSVARIADRLVRVLTALVAAPTAPVGDIDVLGATERSNVLQHWVSSGSEGGTGLFAEPNTTLSSLVDAAVVAHGDRVAVRFGDDGLTYAQLDQRANQLARKLIAKGAGPGQLVAVLLPRSLDLVVALLAVVKSGAGYVPIDPSYPADRITYVLSDAAPSSVIVDGSADTELLDGLTVVSMDGFGVETGDLVDAGEGSITDADRLAPLRAGNTAYVIYTSGSTGRPKGVVVSHRNVVRLFANTDREFGFGPDDVWTLFHSSAFDFSVWELWGALLYGGTSVVVDYFVSRSPEQFLELLHRERVTVLNQTPSAFYQLIEADRSAGVATPLALRYVVFGGEALDLRRLGDWMARHGDGSPGATGPRLVNMYGITETTVHVTHRVLDVETVAAATGSVIGRAIAGLSVY